MDSSLTAVLQEAMYGEQTRGSDGVVYQNKENGIVKYMKLSEIESDELRERVTEIVTEEGDVFYIVLEEVERVMHIWKIPKKQAMTQMMHDIERDTDIEVRDMQ